MTPHQVAIFIEERKWDYRCNSSFYLYQRFSLMYFSVFGFAAALLESIPVVGLIFTISNRVGAAMWAHGTSLSVYECNLSLIALLDLEKKQHFIASERLAGREAYKGTAKKN